MNPDIDAHHPPVDFGPDTAPDGLRNYLTRLPESKRVDPMSGTPDEEQDGDEDADGAVSEMKDLSGSAALRRLLQKGDIVELGTGGKSEAADSIGVFVRRFARSAQFLSITGAWTHQNEAAIQFRISGYIDPALVDAIVPYLPTSEQVEESAQLRHDAYYKDLAVPRQVSGPLLNRMNDFQREAENIYRRHATAFDNAHDILAHHDDMTYGTLTSVARKLLNMPDGEMSPAALWATRVALVRAGPCFSFDRQTHRHTGALQILSKTGLVSLKSIRASFRLWQEDLARVASLSPQQRSMHRGPVESQLFADFIQKVRKIIMRSREDRTPSSTIWIGPSRMRIPIARSSSNLRMYEGREFTPWEAGVLRYIEAWCASHIFLQSSRLASLPPLLLQQIGLYDDHGYHSRTGWLLLQELGYLTPYENPVHFDRHLLLPTSQHSIRLQSLLKELQDLQHNPDLFDSLADLRHDWGDLPVYCVDPTTAQEIDDGISVESAGVDDKGGKLYWLHVHVANPTALFPPEHRLARMAKHMGESVYTPERPYPMLPRWVSLQYASLDRDRPCLTFSAKVDSRGVLVEHRVRAGLIRNVTRLTAEDVSAILDASSSSPVPSDQFILTVGGDPPRDDRPELAISPEMTADFNLMSTLAKQLELRRIDAGARQWFTMKPEPTVWHHSKGPGLPWQHPYRRGSRRIEGDPIIRVPFYAQSGPSDSTRASGSALIMEMMLLASRVASEWCAERKIPIIFRGSVRKPDTPDPEDFIRDVLEPAAANGPPGSLPVHLRHDYLQLMGSTVMSTTPLPHRLLGIDHFAKVTSPLRRYADMIAHWQIGAALREEARLGRSLAGDGERADPSFLPFSQKRLDDMLVGLTTRESTVGSAKKNSARHWILLALFRAIHFGEAELPFPRRPTMYNGSGHPVEHAAGMKEALPLHEPRYIITVEFHQIPEPDRPIQLGMWKEFGIALKMWHPQACGFSAAQNGDVWEAEIAYVTVHLGDVYVIPRRLLERDGQPVVDQTTEAHEEQKQRSEGAG